MKLSVFLEDELSISPGSVRLSIKSQLEKYRDKYTKLTEKKKIHVNVYRQMTNPSTVFVWVKIPSQSLDKFYYDVLLQLDTSGAKSFEDCEVKFFSNSPSFVYGGYAYIFYHLDSDPSNTTGKGMMIDEFRQKIPKDNLLVPKSQKKLGQEAVTEEPVVRNRLGIPMPDFSIYSAIFYMLDEMDFRRVKNTRNYRTVNQLLTFVSSFDHLMVERKREENREKNQKIRKQKAEQEELDQVLKNRTARAGSARGAVRAKSPTRIQSTRKPKSNRGSNGGVNRIG